MTDFVTDGPQNRAKIELILPVDNILSDSTFLQPEATNMVTLLNSHKIFINGQHSQAYSICKI